MAQAFEYLRHGGVENTANLLRFLADTLLREGHGFEAPHAARPRGLRAGRGDLRSRRAAARRRARPSGSSSIARTA